MSTVFPARPISVPTRRRIGLVSTYPPRLCGLATFAAALESALVRMGDRVDVINVDDGGNPRPSARVRAVLVNGDADSVRDAASVLSRCDVAIIQHEYGIYGGPDGDEVLDLLAAIEAPTIVTLHTVPLEPTEHQRSVLERICALAGWVVVMTRAAGDRLVDGYAVDSNKVVTIAHGAATTTSPISVGAPGRAQLLTWGLLGPGKGIEHAIDAVALLNSRGVRVRYTVAGVTHPKVFARSGDQYRQSLIQRAWAGGVGSAVTFDDTYRDVDALARFIATSSVVVLPYDSRDQVTSGVLVDAIAAGRPVIATAFPHAVELLSDGAGIVVPHGDVEALAGAIASVVLDRDHLSSMAAAARRLAPALGWSSVAREYQQLCDRLSLPEAISR